MKIPACKSKITIAGVVFLIGMLFAAYTQHGWEDYWITFRASRNLATGQGLVFTPGERLHTFTSPLGVLLPAGFSWLTGNQSDELPLWLFRFVSITALAAGIVLLFVALRTLQKHQISSYLTVALIGLDAKVLDFSINGMETGLLIFFLALTIHGLLIEGRWRTFRIGIGWTGLMWTRPDSCVYIAVLGLCAFLFLSKRTGGPSHREWWKTFLLSGLVCTVLYLPWFAWAWSYYGSPVPNTVTAKGVNMASLSIPEHILGFFVFAAGLLTDKTSLQWTFLPAYVWFGGWHEILHFIAKAMGLTAAFVWLLPMLYAQTRLFSLAYFLGNYFLTTVVKPFPWYLPTVAVFGYLTIGLLFDQALDPTVRSTRRWPRLMPKLLRTVAVLLITGQLVVTACVAREMQVQQKLIETGLRRQIGLWLREHAKSPRDTVMLEPLGYIGYYSGLKMLDYPGLASKEMVEARRRFGAGRDNLVHFELKPDWLVLRPAEVQTECYIQVQPLNELYELVQVFDATDKVKNTSWLPGRPYLEFDQKFLVFHRKPEAELTN